MKMSIQDFGVIVATVAYLVAIVMYHDSIWGILASIGLGMLIGVKMTLYGVKRSLVKIIDMTSDILNPRKEEEKKPEGEKERGDVNAKP